MIDFKVIGYRDFIKFHTKVRKEFVLRNKEKYTRDCFKVGTVVKFKRTAVGRSVTPWGTRNNRHDPAGEELYGIITSANVQRSGRIQKYNIEFANGLELDRTARGIHQVEAVTEEEARATKLLHDVKRTYGSSSPTEEATVLKAV
jgi:hypothetical protein